MSARKKGERRRRRNEKKEVTEKRESQKQRGGGIVCINTVSSQCRVSFQAFVAAPTMKCVCPQKPYTRSGGFPDLRETERRRKRWRRSRRKSAVANAHSQAGQPERRERARECGFFAGLHSQRGPGKGCLANGAFQYHKAIVMLE